MGAARWHDFERLGHERDPRGKQAGEGGAPVVRKCDGRGECVSLNVFSILTIYDKFVQVLGSVTVPATPTVPSKRYTNVLTLNTAGSNLLLFSCPSTAALISWAAALRLAAWEKSRLEEIYTAHLIRITLSGAYFLRRFFTRVVDLTTCSSRRSYDSRARKDGGLGSCSHSRSNGLEASLVISTGRLRSW